MCVCGGDGLTPKMPSCSPDCCLLRAVEVRPLSFCGFFFFFFTFPDLPRLGFSLSVVKKQMFTCLKIQHFLKTWGDQRKKERKCQLCWITETPLLSSASGLVCASCDAVSSIFRQRKIFVMTYYVGCVHMRCVGLAQGYQAETFCRLGRLLQSCVPSDCRVETCRHKLKVNKDELTTMWFLKNETVSAVGFFLFLFTVCWS